MFLRHFFITSEIYVIIYFFSEIRLENDLHRNITEIYDWDNNTSLNLTVYVKPEDPYTTLISPNIKLLKQK